MMRMKLLSKRALNYSSISNREHYTEFIQYFSLVRSLVPLRLLSFVNLVLFLSMSWLLLRFEFNFVVVVIFASCFCFSSPSLTFLSFFFKLVHCFTSQHFVVFCLFINFLWVDYTHSTFYVLQFQHETYSCICIFYCIRYDSTIYVCCVRVSSGLSLYRICCVLIPLCGRMSRHIQIRKQEYERAPKRESKKTLANKL